MAKRPGIRKHTGVSAGSYNFQQEQERKKGSIQFNVGPDRGKRGHDLNAYYVSAEDWHHKELSHGPARGQVGVKEAKKVTRKHYPHRWMKFHIQRTGRIPGKQR